MSKSTQNYIFAGIALLVVLLGVFFFTQEPFRNDTEKYLKIKQDSWVAVQKAGSSDENVKSALKELNGNLGTIKCSKVEDTYRKECDTLKNKVGQAVELINSNSNDQGEIGSHVGIDIANILKN